MSVLLKGEKLPKKGEKLHSGRGSREQARVFAQAVAKALKEELARGASIKAIMAWTGAGERTVKGWLTGSNVPRGIHLDGLFRASEAVYGLMMHRAGRRTVTTRESLELLRGRLAELAGAIDTTLNS